MELLPGLGQCETHLCALCQHHATAHILLRLALNDLNALCVKCLLELASAKEQTNKKVLGRENYGTVIDDSGCDGT